MRSIAVTGGSIQRTVTVIPGITTSSLKVKSLSKPLLVLHDGALKLRLIEFSDGALLVPTLV